MTSKSPLAQLAELAPSHPRLFRVAWTSISVESKLSLLENLLREGNGSPPEWLVDLVLDPQESEIVRFWAIKNATLTAPQAERVAASDEPLLKIALPYAGGSFFHPTPPSEAMVGMEGVRLFWRFRTYKTAGLGHLIEWLQKGEKDEAYNGDVLNAGAWSFLSRDDVQEFFRECTDGWLETDCMERAGYAIDVKTAWEFSLATRHREVARSMANWLPTYTLNLKAVLALPEYQQRALVCRAWVTKEVRQLILYVVAHPESVSDTVLKHARLQAESL